MRDVTQTVLPKIGYDYYRFGSYDSIDLDVLIDHPLATSSEIDSALIFQLKKQFPIVDKWNMNIIEIKNGIVTKSIPSKGSPDSVNNSLYYTYKFHGQKFNFPLKGKVVRNRDLAIEKCLTAIFTFYKRTLQNQFYKSIPKEIKNGRAPLPERLAYLKRIDFTFKPYLDSNRDIDSYKRIAFHIGQTISLLDGTEIYTKDNLIEDHNDLESIIRRIPLESYSILNEKLHTLEEKIKIFKGY